MLNLPADGTGPRPSKKAKTTAPRPNLKGLAREVQNLGGDNPIAMVPEISCFKKRRFGSRKPAAKWEMRPFRNSARQDRTLILRHWSKKDEGVAQSEPQDGQATGDAMDTDKKPVELEDSSFAKFNVQVDIPQYSEDQYNSSLTSSTWTKDETDYLMDTVRDFDLRWPLIWDRYEYQPNAPEASVGADEKTTDPSTAIVPKPKPRSMEELKARYYEVAARMMAVQRPVQYMNQAEFALHEIMANFNPVDEARRKKFAEVQLSRSKEEAREEESLLIEVRRIMARTEKFNQERRELYNRLDYPHAETTQDLSAFKTSAGLQTLLQNLMSADKSKKRKPLIGTDGANTPASAGPSAHPGSTPVAEHRRESIAASTAGNHRDSVGNDARPEKPTKKGQQQQPERRKLSEQEEQIYGVFYYDRMPSGPTFRYERINKILTNKSHAQHARITNTLAELDIPARLNMPTRAAVEQMEKLLNNIQTLLDLRKVSDKMDGEIKLEEAKKTEGDKLRWVSSSQSEAVYGESKESAPKKDANEKQSGDKKEETPAAAVTASTPSTAAPNGEKTNGEQPPAPEVKQEATDEKMATRPGSSGGHKRSASVLSTVSDKSAKRQKK